MPDIPQKDSFSKQYKTYNKNAIIQKSVADECVKLIDFDFKSVVDIGCGSGFINCALNSKHKNSYEQFFGVDISKNMLELHPKDKNIELICADFDDKSVYDRFKNIDLLISSSSLQWSKNLKQTLKQMSNISDRLIFAIFTDSTFKEINNFFETKSQIYSKKDIIDSIQASMNIESTKTLNYFIKIDSNYEILKYIKNSGVNFRQKPINYKKTKQFLKEFDKNIIEHEVLLFKCKSKRLG